MAIAVSIPGVPKEIDYEREVNDAKHVEELSRATKLNRMPEANDPVVSAAITALQEVSDTFNKGLDVKYDTGSGMIVMTLYNESTGEEIRKIPPEDAIRLAQHRKQMRAQYLEDVL
jgi:uncharacterized FlaG/YvyC family protein